MEPIDIAEGFGDGLRLEDARGRHEDAVARAIATGDWREVEGIAAEMERLLDEAA